MQGMRILAVGRTVEEARERLRGVPGVVATTPEELSARGGLPDAAAAAWVDGTLDEAPALVGELLGRGTPTVISEDAGSLPDGGPYLVGGPGVGSLALARLIGMLRAEERGPLERLVVRQPGGRRVSPAASRRTAFGPDGEVSWALDDDAVERLVALAAPLARAAESILPGTLERAGVSELIADAGEERLVLHGRVDGVPARIELDAEARGDEAWEVEASCADGTLLARFSNGRGVLLVRAPLAKEQTYPDAAPADALLLRHLLKNPDRPALGRPDELLRARARLDALLRGAEERRRSRPIGIVLVHVPRYRNRYDELMLPSLGIARLEAYVRGYGFETAVADLEAYHNDLDLEPFADDARVDAWLAGEADPELEALLDAMWPTLAAAIGERCLVGFSIVDYFGHFQMNLASCLARRVRERTGQPTVLGGERDQVDGDRALRAAMPFDHVVDGDGEEALYALAQLYAYDDRDARHVRAVWTRYGDGVVKNRIVRSHLNAMPRPRFDGMPLERYRRGLSRALIAALEEDGVAPDPLPEPSLYLPYGFVKGCTADCTFCSAKEHLDVQAPQKTVDELLALSERHGVKDFVFLDNLVNLGPGWLRKFCQRLIDAGADLQWTDSCRPTGIDEELALMMRASGCLLLNYGAESGSDTILERMRKGLSRADIVRTLRATHAAGIINRVNLIAGYFHETDADVDQTISLVEELEAQIDVIGCFQGFYLFEGMGVDPEREGIVLRDDLDRLKTGQTTLAYDEIGGLRWEDKREKIDASRNRILARIEELGIRTIDKIDEYDLFWLSRAHRDKAFTTRYLLRVPRAEVSRINQASLMPGGQSGRVVEEL